MDESISQGSSDPNLKPTKQLALKNEKEMKIMNDTNTSDLNTQNIICAKALGTEKLIGLRIKNLSDLQKATPKLKLPAILTSPNKQQMKTIPSEVKQTLFKYCRFCAELKVPLVDIFSERGVQMKLRQQVEHLEDIDQDNSLSTKICMDCICDLKMSYNFFIQLKKAETKLQSICDRLSKASSSKSDPSDKISKTDTTFDLNISDDDNARDDGFLQMSNCSENDIVETLECGKSGIPKLSDDQINDLLQSTAHNELSNENDLNRCDQSNVLEPSKDIQDNIFTSDEALDANIEIPLNQQSPNKGTKVKIEPNAPEIKSNQVNQTQNLSTQIPNILKRKVPSRDVNHETTEANTKTGCPKLNIDLKDLKIPKLDLNEANVRKEEDGVMYVTAKGSNPNEMLLIKVRRVDKPAEKKPDKKQIKKKDSSIQELFSTIQSKNQKSNQIKKQLKQYEKKREKLLGPAVHLQEENHDEQSMVLDDNTTNDHDDIVLQIEDEPSDSGGDCDLRANSSSLTDYSVTEKHKDNSNGNNTAMDDPSEASIRRLKSVLNQKEEYIIEFASYLKQRRIVASRLKDEDIITLYEKKNNVVIEKSPPEPEKDVDPFEPTESYDCDFCFKSFSNEGYLSEHSKIHDIKLLHYCGDCNGEFATHKAKRHHSVECKQKLLCRYCNMILESKGKKRQHEQKHIDEKYGQLCDKCGAKFKHQGTLDQHYRGRHMNLEKIFKCPECPKRFAQRTKLTFHLKTVHVNYRAYLCEDCGSDFKNKASLRHHKIRKHMKINNKKECKVCQKMIPVYSMSKHMHTHRSYTIDCPQCDKKFKNTSTLKQHLRIHDDQREYVCDQCGVGFNRRDGLKLHLKVHEKSGSQKLKECSCQLCGEKFESHSRLVLHRSRVHKEGRSFTCPICNRSMVSARTLSWHMANIHHQDAPQNLKDDSVVDIETKRVTCDLCNKTFKTEMILRSHVKNTHSHKEPMKCLDCEQMFTSEVRLKHHMMIKHGRLEDTLSCPHCPKRFVNHLRLKTHLISHSEVRPYPCEICGFTLKTKVQLMKHKQNRHSNERPLQCKYCSWRCKQVSALVCHERTHTNERPYTCSVCKQKFKYLGDKNKHERRHESLGGAGFKRIITERNTNKDKKNVKDQDSTEDETDPEVDTVDEEEEDDEGHESSQDFEASKEQIMDAETQRFIKLESGEMADVSETSFEQFVNSSQGTSVTSGVAMRVDETTVYTEEVTADHMDPELITDDLNGQVLRPGTVVHIQQQDKDGKIQVIPVMLALPDLTDASPEVNLATASIMYNS
ncbi:hypothetical protein QAD02_004857 [Eretmocerus hayati]|uniref:Uncharacterized protein n=1 Tax=Eretmocerus hayati TaxID=131215 RepID=A0ACC2NQV9_9HYME|nr:hypothetical protein QAD02_004857 [Eretmocerus hayati]